MVVWGPNCLCCSDTTQFVSHDLLLCESEDSWWFMEEVFHLNAKSHTALGCQLHPRPAPIIISFPAKGWNLTKFGKIWANSPGSLNLWRGISDGARARPGVTHHVTSHCVMRGPNTREKLDPEDSPGAKREKIQSKLLTFRGTYWLISEWNLLCFDETKETIRLPSPSGLVGPGLKMRRENANK